MQRAVLEPCTVIPQRSVGSSEDYLGHFRQSYEALIHEIMNIQKDSDMGEQYTIDSNHIIYEEIDSELVVINLKNGCYYSLNESAALIWKLIANGNSIDNITGLLVAHFSIEPDGIPGEIVRIVSEFSHEQLLSPAVELETKTEMILPDDIKLADHFQSPVISKHSDIQEMLQLDPIHEVTDLGWPNKK
jgi:hypothetical protein